MDASQIPTNAKIVTPSDSAPANGNGLIYSGGTCTVVTDKGDTVTFPVDFALIVIPLQIKKVMATGTTATSVLVFR